jgi:YHS domain-containing protein
VIRSVLFFIYGLIVLMVVRMVMQWIGRLFGEQARGRRPDAVRRPAPRGAEDLVRDPVCNTYVPRSRALPATIEGRSEMFCSEACRDKARAAVPSVS